MSINFNVNISSSLKGKLDLEKYIDAVSEETERQLHESSSKTA